MPPTSLLISPERGAKVASLGQLIGASAALALVELARDTGKLVVVLTHDPREADQLEAELRYFAGNSLDVRHFVEWETLPYDAFSPHQDIISQRLSVLGQLPSMSSGIVVLTAASLLQRLPPKDYVGARTLRLKVGDQLDRDAFIAALTAAGYYRVPEVSEHGEFAIRGALFDVFPMGSDAPIRIDLFDDEIDSLRYFDSQTQVSAGRVDEVAVLPASEVPLDAESIRGFRDRYRERFEGQPSRSRVYREVSDGIAHGGIEYYLPLFFEHSAGFLDYCPNGSLMVVPTALEELLESAWSEVEERYELCNIDAERPILNPAETFHHPETLGTKLTGFRRISWSNHSQPESRDTLNVATRKPPALRIESRYEDASAALLAFLDEFDGRVLFTADSPGRRESVLEFLRGRGLDLDRYESWQAFVEGSSRIGVAVAPLEDGVLLLESRLAIISEHQLFGDRPKQRRRLRRSERDPESIIKQLNDLEIGSPVVHESFGVGRYQGLVTLEPGGISSEFLMLEYADSDKLYVPVQSLDLISRYTGASPENAPLHRLGSDQWAKARKRDIARIRDVAAELLDIYARRAARPGRRLKWPESDYRAFESGFPFEATEDQQQAIDDVLEDLASDRPMDRIVCGDVGFGKTEVALRAAFAAVHAGKQVVLLVPTTLLAQQHGQTFKDRFADWPVQVEVLSRFRSRKEVDGVVAGLKSGNVDIVVGTHRLLQHVRDIEDLGLVIIDEEHRFGVRHKEALKALKSEVDVLTLTATPIPRTLNLALGGLREMSLITTPPAERLAVKTFVAQWNDSVVREACLREIKRGGQVYFVHNRVQDIEDIGDKLEKLVPEASIRVGHGQMPERELEQVMIDFYHRRFNLLLCTTIIESGIDVPTANTIIINRADRFGLAQLHQLRGRVGRSHHRAFAYMIAPPRKAMTADAQKRLEAIDSLEDLGAGFTLATHDLEIRGAGELLGETQSGQMHEIGFSLYTEMLGRTIDAMKRGDEIDLEKPLNAGVEINLHIPALLPDDYVPDVHLRLILYKRIASTTSAEELRELQVELIDRFGLLPAPAKTLMRTAEVKLRAQQLGIEKIDVAESAGYAQFREDASIDPMTVVRLVQNEGRVYRMRGPHRLQFTGDYGDVDARIAALDSLLDKLEGNSPAAEARSA